MIYYRTGGLALIVAWLLGLYGIVGLAKERQFKRVFFYILLFISYPLIVYIIVNNESSWFESVYVKEFVHIIIAIAVPLYILGLPALVYNSYKQIQKR